MDRETLLKVQTEILNIYNDDSLMRWNHHGLDLALCRIEEMLASVDAPEGLWLEGSVVIASDGGRTLLRHPDGAVRWVRNP